MTDAMPGNTVAMGQKFTAARRGPAGRGRSGHECSGRHAGPDGAPLLLVQTSPDTEGLARGQRVVTAVRQHRARTADRLGCGDIVERRSTSAYREERLGLGTQAGCLVGPLHTPPPGSPGAPTRHLGPATWPVVTKNPRDTRGIRAFTVRNQEHPAGPNKAATRLRCDLPCA